METYNTMGPNLIRRHTKITICMHWFNALCWFFLLATGLGLIKNDSLQILDGWWADTLRSFFGSPEAVLQAHETTGFIWAGVFFIYGIWGAKKIVIPFMREILSYSFPRDMLWLMKKGIQMTLGYRLLSKIGHAMEKRGFTPEVAEARIPDQGFYNTGQKLFAIPSLLGGFVIALTGIIMALSDIYFTATTLVQWAIVIHFVTVGVVSGGLLIHIYMASIAAGERPAFISMFTGKVPEDYAKHHHRLWYEALKSSDR